MEMDVEIRVATIYDNAVVFASRYSDRFVYLDMDKKDVGERQFSTGFKQEYDKTSEQGQMDETEIRRLTRGICGGQRYGTIQRRSRDDFDVVIVSDTGTSSRDYNVIISVVSTRSKGASRVMKKFIRATGVKANDAPREMYRKFALSAGFLGSVVGLD